MRSIQAREGVLTSGGIQRVLCERGTIGAAKGAEDLAHVIQGLAERVASPHGQLLEQVIGAELHLRAVVVRIAAIIAGTNHAIAATDASYVSPGAGANLVCCCRRSETC